MVKKFSLLLAAVAATAFGVPADAGANPSLTVGGSSAPAGTILQLSSSNFSTTLSIGKITCASVNVNAEVTKNSEGIVEIEGTGGGETATCFFRGTTPITIHDYTLIDTDITQTGQGTAIFTYTATLPNLTCHLSGAAVPLTYGATTNVIHLKGALHATPAACGTGSIDATFTLSSSGGGVILH